MFEPLDQSGERRSMIGAFPLLQLADAGVPVRKLTDPAPVEVGETAEAEAGRREVSADVVQVKAPWRVSLDDHRALLSSGVRAATAWCLSILPVDPAAA